MKIVDEALLQEFRETTRCEWCGVPVYGFCHPHHVFARGMGGGGRLDIRVNVIALCWVCHNDAHHGKIDRAGLIAVVARREGKLQHQIIAIIHKYRRTFLPRRKNVSTNRLKARDQEAKAGNHDQRPRAVDHGQDRPDARTLGARGGLPGADLARGQVPEVPAASGRSKLPARQLPKPRRSPKVLTAKEAADNPREN